MRTTATECFASGMMIFLSFIGLGQERAASVQGPSPITYKEAVKLLRLIPDALKIRSEGMDIGWDRTTAPELNQEDYFFFYVYNSKRVSYGSVTVGNYAVNKHTGDVWNSGEVKLVSDLALSNAQKALRQIHKIDDRTIQQFRSRPLEKPAKRDSGQH